MIRKRLWLFFASCLTLLLVAGWFWVVIRFQPEELRPLLGKVLLFLSLTTVAGMALVCLRGPVFSQDGSFQRSDIIVVLGSLLCVVQIAMTFIMFFWQYTALSTEGRSRASALFEAAAPCMAAGDFQLSLPEGGWARALHIIAVPGGEALASTDEALLGGVPQPDPLLSYRFPQGNYEFIVEFSAAWRRGEAFSILLQLFTVAAGSLIMTVELVLLFTGMIERRRQRREALIVEAAAAQAERADRTVRSSASVSSLSQRGEGEALLFWVRPLAFMFYFASRLSSSFLPVMASELPGSIPGLSAQTAVGMPQSAELLLACVAIGCTASFMRRWGWKPPFVAGLITLALGTLFCVWAKNIFLFTLARALVGMGYGFCWMTLRNLCLFAPDTQSSKLSFAMLSAGIFAGMGCGTALGALLADLLGFEMVLLLSAVLVLFFGLALTPLRNAKASPVTEAELLTSRAPLKREDYIGAFLFILLMVIPACLVTSFTGTYIPLHFSHTGRSISDTGSAQLLYGMAIIYAGPFLTRLTGRFHSLWTWNIICNLVFSCVLVLFGGQGGFLLALSASMMLGFVEGVGSVTQNYQLLSLPMFARLDKMGAFTSISLLKKLAECLGPPLFAVLAGYGVRAVSALGWLFLVAVALFVVGTFFLRKKAVEPVADGS